MITELRVENTRLLPGCSAGPGDLVVLLADVGDVRPVIEEFIGGG